MDVSGKASKAEHIEILDARQVAAKLGTTVKSLHNGTMRGLIPSGRRVPGLGLRWRVDEIDDWLAQKLPRRDLPCA